MNLFFTCKVDFQIFYTFKWKQNWQTNNQKEAYRDGESFRQILERSFISGKKIWARSQRHSKIRNGIKFPVGKTEKIEIIITIL
jgi:hypothetical protein